MRKNYLFLSVLSGTLLFSQNNGGYERQWGTLIGPSVGVSQMWARNNTLIHSPKIDAQNNSANIAYYNGYTTPGAAGYDPNATTNYLHQVFSSSGQLVNAHFSSLEWVPDASGNILTVKNDPTVSSLPYNTWLPNNPVAPQTYADILSKYDSAENVLWRTFLPGQQRFVTTDPNGNIYIAGTTLKTDLATPNTWQTTFTVSYLTGTVIRENNFLAKISPQGQLLWCTYIPAKEVWMLDASNTTIGIISSKDFLNENTSMATPGAFQTQKREYAITSLDAATGRRNWGTYYGDPGSQNSINYLRVTPNGFLVRGYEINGQGYFATPGALKDTPTGKDVFISRFSIDGTQRLWSTYLGTNGPENTYGLTGGLSVNYSNGLCYKDGKILYVGNSSAGTNNIATPGAFQTTPTAVYMTMLNETTGGQIFTSYYGPNTLDYQQLRPGSCAFSDTEDSFYITGNSTINSNLVTPGAPYSTITSLPSQPATATPSAGFLAKFKYNPLLATAETASPAAGLTLVDNPNAGIFKIMGNALARENCTVQVSDMAGRLILSQKLKKSATAEIQLPAEVAAGNYWVAVTDPSGHTLKTWQMQVKK